MSQHETTSAGLPSPRAAAEPVSAAEPSSADETALTAALGPDKPEGPVAAAMLASGVGVAALGVITTLAEASTSVKEWLQWNDGVGPLSGKTGLAVAVWLLAWVVLHAGLRRRSVGTRRALVVTLVLIGVGVLGTFPTFFQLFAGE